MSTVDKMLIKGIRSFDPENKNVITFFRPLTLIVGSNGAGKTTIIECLKVSCTGELPPNARSGHSFIHDPKVAGETETKAQIKLRFKTAAGKDVVCIRSFQLTQKASKMEYKAIESVLQTINPHTGEKVCLSYRCADMDREIPALMGVSKAILENVIFVHQDESNWPLQDPSTLKKKFDDIFSATRYTKALEVIKKLHKDQAQEIKTFKLKLENLQTLKDAAYKLRESITQDQERTESSKAQMSELENSIQKVDAEVHNKEMMLKDLRKLQDQVSRKTAERSTLFKEQQRQYAALPEENEDTIEELKEWKSKFEERIALLETKIRKMEREMDDTQTTISSLHNAKTNYMLEISKLQTEAEAHMLLKDERDTSIQKTFSHHNLGNVPSTPFSTEVVLNLTNRIKSRLGEFEMDLVDKKKSNEAALSTAWDCYMDANDRWKSIEAQKRAKDDIKTGISKRIEEKEIERDSFEFEISNVDVQQIDEREKLVQVELERKSKQNSESGFESKIEQKQHEIYSMEHKIKTLNRERDVMAGDAEDRVKLSLKKTELENLKKKHKKIIDECKDKIRGALKGRLPLEKDMKKEIVQALRSVEREYGDLSLKSREAEKEVNMWQMKIQEVNNSLSKHHKDTESRKRYIESKLQALKQESFTIDAYPKLLDSAKDKRDYHKSKYNMATGMRQMFEPFEQVAREHHFCPCCERTFSAQEEDNFVKKQRAKASTTGDHVKALAAESSNADSIFQQLDNLRSVFEEYTKLTDEIIPLAEKSLQEFTEELEQKSEALDDVLAISAQIKSDKDSIEALVQPLENADRLFQEIASYQKQIEDLEYKLDFRGHGVKTMQEIQSELSSLQSTKDKLHDELQKLRDEQIYMERDISCLQARWHALREEKAKAANLLRDVTKAEEDLERLAEEKSQLDLDVK
ncbi:DNA repair protein RAD50-like, partial [Raphanus sativus]